MKICVTGASGYLGTKLIKKLINSGFEVFPILRTKSKEFEDNTNCLVEDLCNREKLSIKLKEFSPDIVIHCAAHIPKSLNREEQLLSKKK